MPQHRHKAALFYFQIYPAETFVLITGIGKMQIFYFDNSFQLGIFLSLVVPQTYFALQRQLAPQGSHSPLSVTGKPSSCASE